jgi:2-polyprenyl-3-methyl-5-hydroxy-6-metoxy-1,4-benzoquinol methylase
MTASRLQLARASLGLRSLYPFVLHALADVAPEQRAGLTLVDLPCGDGMLAFPLRAVGFNVRALDLFPEYLNSKEPQVRGRGAAGVFEQMSGERLPAWLAQSLWGAGGDAPIPGGLLAQSADMEGTLPLDDASVDVLVCAEGIEHVVDRHRVLAEFRRVLKPGGRLLLTTPNLLSARARLAFALTGQRAMRSLLTSTPACGACRPTGSACTTGTRSC